MLMGGVNLMRHCRSVHYRCDGTFRVFLQAVILRRLPGQRAR
jgi:hypothetical protein